MFGAQHQVAGADGFAQALGHHLEQVVAHVVAQGVVDALEGIEVHEQHGEFLVVLFRAHQFAFQCFQKGLPVGDACQAVAIGKAADLFFRALALADVAHQAQHFIGPRRHQARLEVTRAVFVGERVVDRADVLRGQHGVRLVQQARGDFGRQHVADMAAHAVAEGKAGAGVVALFVVEIKAFAVQAKEGVGDGGQHGAVVRVGNAQAGDGVAGAQHVQCAMAQDGPVDGLGNEIRGAHFVGTRDRIQLVVARDHDDGHGAAHFLEAYFAAYGKAVQGRHVDVEHDQVRPAVLVTGQRLHAVFGLDHVQAHLREHLPHQHAHHGIVVGNQHQAAWGREGRCHVSVPSRGWRSAIRLRPGRLAASAAAG